MGKRLEQTLQTKENLKTAFWDLYQEKPLDQITVREVTELAGYNRGTFYVYYKDVYDVLEQTEREILSIFESDEPFDFNPKDREHFEGSIRYFVEFIESHFKYLILLTGEQGDPKFVRLLQSAVERNVSDRLRPFSGLDNVAFSYAVAALISAEAALVMRWFMQGKDLPFEQLVDLLYNLLYHGPLDLLTRGTQWEKRYCL